MAGAGLALGNVYWLSLLKIVFCWLLVPMRWAHWWERDFCQCPREFYMVAFSSLSARYFLVEEFWRPKGDY
ncbi:hypothetical protein GCM10007416_25910 [Kroppenstedtia guangzhouensis]|uniref:Uncharacterized protein n=1 Tax=Kroppenstedtia guangzhouensis TaxID=1274356 RepID=A0ABQ1GX84_9BACL|nr:hypothetical protein GCM10007416_25910 [Kroppenstedtia guangzhouensis]